MSDEERAEKTDGYLLVLHMWAKIEFMNLCAAVASATSEAEKQECIRALKLEAPRLTAIMAGIETVQEDNDMTGCDALVADLEEQIEEKSGQLGVARDLFNEALESTTLTARHRAAMREWLADVAESANEELEDGSEPSQN